jgi:GAF domain
MSGVALYDSDAGVLRAHVLEYLKPLPNFAPGTPIPMQGTTAGLAFTTGQPVFVDKPDLERFTAQYTREALETGVRSGGSIPLIAHGRKLGTLGIASQESAFSEEDEECYQARPHLMRRCPIGCSADVDKSGASLRNDSARHNAQGGWRGDALSKLACAGRLCGAVGRDQCVALPQAARVSSPLCELCGLASLREPVLADERLRITQRRQDAKFAKGQA